MGQVGSALLNTKANFAPPEGLSFHAEREQEDIISSIQRHIELIASLGDLIKCSNCGAFNSLYAFPCSHCICKLFCF